jgi:hypothetical protein
MLPDGLKSFVLRSLGAIPPLENLYDRWSLPRAYERVFGNRPDLEHPKSFNEKILWRLLFDRRPILVAAADKLAARQLAEKRAGPEILPKLLAVFDRGHEIPWQQLPDRFVLKANHGSGFVKIVKEKAGENRMAVEKTLERWTRSNYYTRSREWAYKAIKPKLFAEEFLGDGPEAPPDYKFFVFAGRAVYLQVDTDRFTAHRRNPFDRDLRDTGGEFEYPRQEVLTLSADVEAMWSVADKLGEGFDFVRVDLFTVGGQIKFGEFTNYPDAGKGRFRPESLDRAFGDAWVLARS